MLDASEVGNSFQKLFIGRLTVNNIAESRFSDWLETIDLNGQDLSFKLDTGSHANILPEHLVLK